MFQLKILILSATTVATVFAFQNCSGKKFEQDTSSSAVSTASNGSTNSATQLSMATLYMTTCSGINSLYEARFRLSFVSVRSPVYACAHCTSFPNNSQDSNPAPFNACVTQTAENGSYAAIHPVLVHAPTDYNVQNVHVSSGAVSCQTVAESECVASAGQAFLQQNPASLYLQPNGPFDSASLPQGLTFSLSPSP